METRKLRSFPEIRSTGYKHLRAKNRELLEFPKPEIAEIRGVWQRIHTGQSSLQIACKCPKTAKNIW